jgi:hypothetical protein
MQVSIQVFVFSVEVLPLYSATTLSIVLLLYPSMTLVRRDDVEMDLATVRLGVGSYIVDCEDQALLGLGNPLRLRLTAEQRQRYCLWSAGQSWCQPSSPSRWTTDCINKSAGTRGVVCATRLPE